MLAEAARLEIETKLARGMTIEEIVTDPDWLQSVVRRSTAQEAQLPTDEVWFLDRGTPDSIAYYRKFGREPEPEVDAAFKAFKCRKVFLLDLVDYVNDYARPETPEEARALHEGIRAGYTELGHEVVPVPLMPVQERVQFILARL